MIVITLFFYVHNSVPLRADTLSRNLIIALEDPNEAENQKVRKKSWLKACRLLSKHLTAFPPQSRGVFSKVACETKIIHKDFDSYKQKVQSSWLLKVTNKTTQHSLELFYKRKSGFSLEAHYYVAGVGGEANTPSPDSKPGNMATKNTKTSDKFLTALSDPTVVEPLTLVLLDQLPFAAIITFNQDGQAIISLPPNLLDDTLMVFDLSYDKKEDLWQARVLGFATAQGKNWHFKIHRGTINYQQTYFAQSVRGRGLHNHELTPKVQKGFEKHGFLSFLESLFTTFNSSFVGIRIGIPLIKGNKLLSNSRFISSFFESRTGILKGLRLYYDTVPEVKDETQFYGWKRLSLGWSFNLPTPKPLTKMISRMDISLKIGIVTLDATFDLKNTEGEYISALPFKTEKSLSLGGEFGVEHLTGPFMIRAWASFDRNGTILNSDEIVYSSIKAGLDNYYDLYQFNKKLKLQSLVFFLYERPRYSFQPSDSTSNDLGIYLESVSYHLFYGGGGFTLSW
jgi:hypothetical protein